tara:strand:+ start:3029 stop:3772 length:744 start_codon:yes stop_codon:yes gene_type:complete
MITAGHIDNDIGHVSLGNVPRNLSNSQVSSYKASIVEPVYRHTSDASVFMANRQTAPAAPAAATWTTAKLIDLANIEDLENRFELTLQPSVVLPAGTDVIISGLYGPNQPSGGVSFTSLDGVFSNVSWDGLASVTLTPALDIPSTSTTFVTFDIYNGPDQPAVTPSLEASGMTTKVLDPILEIIDAADISNLITSGHVIADDGFGNPLTETDLLALDSPTDYQMYWAGDVYRLYVWNGSVWLHYDFS